MTRKVGYGSPPTHSQWQKGQSGNPCGRKRGSVNFATDLLAELAETIAVTEGGKPKRITKQRAMLKALITKAIKGDVRAASAAIGLKIKHDAVKVDAEDLGLTPAEKAAFDDLVNRRAALVRAQAEKEGKQ